MPLLFAVLALAQSPVQPDEQLAAWGFETLTAIKRDYAIPGSNLYADTYEPASGKKTPAFNWAVGVMLSALNSAAKLDPKYVPSLRAYADATRVYWNDKGPVPGYDVLPTPKPVDRYYDDNAWMALALIETFEITGDKKYLGWAEDSLRYVMSGEDKARGGIFWRESDKASRNTCSTGPAAAACLALFRVTKEAYLLRDAIRLYSWTKKTLQDPEDGLLWDGIANSGQIGKTKWSYNTALMIRSAAELYAVTRNGTYLADLKKMQAASAKRWLGESFRDEGRFAHLLVDSWLYQRERAPVPREDLRQADLKALYEPLAWLRTKGANADGRFGKRFDTPPASDQQKFELIDQASAARAFLQAAFYFKAGA